MDSIANMLIAIKNAGLAKRASVTIPHSKMKEAILKVLKNEGYIKTYHAKEGDKPALEVVLEYKGTAPRISGVTRVSKVSNRVYRGVKDIAPVKYGYGISVFSTPKGIMTDKEARKEQVGGEVLFTIW